MPFCVAQHTWSVRRLPPTGSTCQKCQKVSVGGEHTADKSLRISVCALYLAPYSVVPGSMVSHSEPYLLPSVDDCRGNTHLTSDIDNLSFLSSYLQKMRQLLQTEVPEILKFVSIEDCSSSECLFQGCCLCY